MSFILPLSDIYTSSRLATAENVKRSTVIYVDKKHPYLNIPGPVVLAHRGGTYPGVAENSIPAFQRALELGAHYLETDVHLSVDGVLIASHDAAVGPNKFLHIPSTRAEVIAREHVGGVALYPKFEDLLDSLDESARLNIDVKSGEATKAFADLLLRRPELLKRVCVGSFFDNRISYLRERFGKRLCTSMGPVETLKVVAGAKPVADVAQIPIKFHGVRVLTSSFVERAHAAGCDVHVWTLNRETEIKYALSQGVDGIVTDEVELALNISGDTASKGKES